MIAAGVGYRNSATSAQIEAVVRDAMQRVQIKMIDVLAIPAFKLQQDAAQQATRRLTTRLYLVDTQALASAAPHCINTTTRQLPGCGQASVAEATAIAAIGQGAVLLQTRIKHSHATCALAYSHDGEHDGEHL